MVRATDSVFLHRPLRVCNKAEILDRLQYVVTSDVFHIMAKGEWCDYATFERFVLMRWSYVDRESAIK